MCKVKCFITWCVDFILVLLSFCCACLCAKCKPTTDNYSREKLKQSTLNSAHLLKSCKIVILVAQYIIYVFNPHFPSCKPWLHKTTGKGPVARSGSLLCKHRPPGPCIESNVNRKTVEGSQNIIKTCIVSMCVTRSQAYTMLNIHDLRTQLSCGQVSSCFLSCEGISYTSLTRGLFWQLCLWKLCTQVGVHITGSVPHATNHRVLYSRDAQDGYIPLCHVGV